MKISHNNNNSVNLKAYINSKNVEDTKKTKTVGNEASRDVGRGDRVVLSSKAKEINEVKKILNDVPDIREEKVAKIKSAIEKGTYKVDGKKIAFEMIRESLLNQWL